MGKRISTRDSASIGARIMRGEDFQTHGALKGESGRPYPFGRLPRTLSDYLYERGAKIDYVIYSYATPIAWHDKDYGWAMPGVKYSVTTSHHQGTIRRALAMTTVERIEA